MAAATSSKKLGATAERTRVNFQMTAPAGRRSSTDKAARSTGTRSLNSTAKGASTASVPGYEWSPEDAAAAVEHTNPFAMPREDDIFAVRDRERAAKKAEREHINRMRVHEKAAYHAQKTRRLRVKVNEDDPDDDFDVEDDEASAAHNLALSTRDRHVEQEHLADYIDKKREMFLVQYSLGVKREEMRKLERTAQLEEEKLEEAERRLEADAAKFDTFLKDNDKNSVEAIKQAEVRTKIRMEKFAEAKKINSEISALKSDISKNEDTLKELHTYRDFLEMLSPHEWAEEQRAIRDKVAAEQQRRRAQHEAANSVSFPVPMASTGGPGTRKPVRRRSRSKLGQTSAERLNRQSSGRRALESGSAASMDSVDMPPEDCDNLDADLVEPRMFFSEPEQLLSMFAELEEQNLSLITNGQETEEALQDLEDRVSRETEDMKKEREFLQRQLDELNEDIERVNYNAEQFRERSNMFSTKDVEEQEKEMAMLDKRVGEVYQNCIGENEASISTLQMLTNIENRMEDLFEKIERMPPEKVEEAERRKEKERRLRAREEKLAAQKRHQEERVRRALARAKAEPKKQVGKKLVFRSAPPANKQKDTSLANKINEEEEEMRFFFG